MIKPPAELAFLTDVISAEATLALIEARAGTRVYVPGADPDASLLAAVIGVDAARALAQQYGGCTITVPSAKRWRAHVYRARGMQNPEIALKLGLNIATVKRFFSTTLGQRAHAAQAPQRHPRPTQTELPI